MKRNLTPDEETVIRLCHHEFGGESIETAAVYMGVEPLDVQEYLCTAEKKAPQMFPILWPQLRAILLMYDQHMSRKAIAVGLGISLATLKKKVTFLRKHGFLWDRLPDQYRPSMDGDVKEVF